MILAAGLGTRLKPFTNHHPKALAPVAGKPILQRNIEHLQLYGITNLVVNVHHFAEQVIDALHTNHGWGSQVTISHETPEALETGGGLQNALRYFEQEEDLLMLNADVLTNIDFTAMIGYHRQKNAFATLATTNRSSSRFLYFDDTTNRLCGWGNSKTSQSIVPLPALHMHTAAFSGIQIINRAIFNHMPFTGKFSIIDVYLHFCQQYPIYKYDHSQGWFFDIGTPEKLEQATAFFEMGHR